tara:strand:+ start:163224 stop:163667 length:444 start_codon:yes stop_codon:yes gene_type:complete
MRNVIISVVIVLLGGCQSVSGHREAVSDTSVNNLTVGVVQKEVRVGMSSASVVEILGSPNIVSTDEQRREVWVYDKISTDTAYSTSSGGVSALILGGLTGVPLGAGVGGGYNKNTGASSKSQKTLTVIIKFDKASKVRDFAYHTSRF